MHKIKILLITSVLMLFSGEVFSHCQIPCGIYDDQLRIKMISEDIDTVEKSISAIEELSKEKIKDYNQLVRWINNKDEHAGRIQQIVSEYFLCQRIKPVGQNEEKAYKIYTEQLALLHQLSFYAMRSKQEVEMKNAGIMRSLLDNFSRSYFKK